MNKKRDLVTRDGTEESTDKGNGEEWQLVLQDSEAAILRAQIAEPAFWLNSRQFLWSCTSVLDGLILLGSGLAAVVAGAALPLSMLLLGNMGQSFRDFFVGSNTRADFTDDVNRLCLFYIYLAIAEFVSVYIATVGFTMAGERIAQQIREAYLAAVLRQNMAYFESLKVGEVNTRLTADVNSIQDAITGKASATLTAVATFVSALIICFVTSWRLSLVMLAAPALIVASMSIAATFMVKYTGQALAAYTPAASIAEEAISSIRTVAAFGMQSRLVAQYKVHLEAARRAGVKSGISLACMLGVMNAVIFWSYGLAFWQGSRWLMHDKVSLSAILTILFAVIIGAFALGNVSPHAQAFVNGITTVEKISQAVSHNSAIDPSLATGDVLSEMNGEIEMKNIRHVYPSRPDTLVIDNFCHTFPPGKMTAIVGSSGCGKSTIVGLIERFYLPVGGSIYLDGHDIASLNVSWLRQQIGLVSQEPALFSTTIFQNIQYGLNGSQYRDLSLGAIREMVERAARTANAFEFIMDLPEGFMTRVDDGGTSLSGGQKQRIAIARAIIGDPKILILDEATSALDSHSEQNVQLALEKAAQGRTTIAIAHRLSTIFAADNILVMSKGKIVEQGTHEQLVGKESIYAEMVSNQQINSEAAALMEDEKSTVEKGEEKMFSAEPTELNRQAVEKSNTEDQTGHSTWTLARFVFRLNPDDKLLLSIGLCCSVVAGASYPTQSVFLAKIVQALSVQPSLYGHLRQQVNLWCGMYLMVGFTALLGWFGQGVCFAYYSQRLTYRARASTFTNTLHHDMASFLREDHSTASLTTILSNSANNLQGLSGVVLGTLLVILTQLMAGFTVATAIGWKLGLVCASTIPIQIGCGILRLKCLTLLESHSRRMYESSAAYACEYSANIRTVAPLTLEPKILEDYHKILETQRKKSFASMTQSSLLYAASQSLNLLCVALAFWYGGRLVATANYSMFQFFVCYTAIVNGAYSAGAIFSFAPDIGKARDSAYSLKLLFDRPIDIDARSNKGTSPNSIRGVVQVRNVSFRYPNRPERRVLDGVSLDIWPGQFVALVGASGSGKSTIISLLERFFDTYSGSIEVDGVSLPEWNVRDYRRQVALVSQMPTLFDGTIRENIVLGLGEDENTSDADITKACKDANIYEFITSLPDGFNTRVGARGTMLSGGQKQRVAIARALIRNPKVLLLDEATSALDSASGRAVQKALDAAAGSRTTIAVAHRISTVEKADCIYVLDRGKIVESGTHQNLMKLNGKYKELSAFQSFGEATA